MPARTKRGRKTRKLTDTSVRCSSMASAFCNGNLPFTSSPIEGDSKFSIDAVETRLKISQNYNLEFKNYYENVLTQQQNDMTEFETFMFNLKMSIPEHLANAKMGDLTYSVEKQAGVDLDNSSMIDSCLQPVVRRNAPATDSDVFKRPLGRKAVRKTNKLPPPSLSSQFKTPQASSSSMFTGSMMTITPKMNPNTPMHMMRRPKQGEVAVSMTGSPLLVSTIVHDELPTVSIPFADGRVFSIMPNQGTVPDNLPNFDEKTKACLKTLQDHLKQFCS